MRYSYFYEVLVIFSAIFLIAHRGFSFQHGESESRAVANSDMSEGIVFSCDGKKAGDISAIKQRMEEMLEKEFKWNKSVYEINEKIEGGVSRLQFRLKNKSQNTLDLHTRPELKIKDVKETWVSGSHTEYTKMVVSVNEITAAMMTRGRVSEFKGESCDFNHFLDHVMMRQEISRWATRFNAEFPYRNWNADRTGKVPRFNSDYWDKDYLVKKGESVIDAIDDEFNGNFVYEMGCEMAVKSILMQGIFKHLGKDKNTRKLIEEIATNDPYQDSSLPSKVKSGDSKYLTRQNNVPALHWIPGDWGYLVNRDAKSAKTVQGAEGHNMPYIGGGVFAHYYNSFGNHASIEKNIDKMQAWPFEAEYKEQADKLAGKAWEKWQDENDAHEGQMHWSLMKWAEKKDKMSDKEYKKLINEAKTNSEDRDGKPTAKGMIDPTRDYPKIFSKTVSNDKRYSELLKKQDATPHEEQVQVAKAEEKPKSEQKVVEKEVSDEKEAVKLIKGSDYKKKKKGYEYLASHAPTVELQKTLIADLKHRPKSGEEEKREVVELSLKIVESQLEKFTGEEREKLKSELKALTEIPVEQGQRASHIKEHAKELLEKLERKEEPESKNAVAAPSTQNGQSAHAKAIDGRLSQEQIKKMLGYFVNHFSVDENIEKAVNKNMLENYSSLKPKQAKQMATDEFIKDLNSVVQLAKKHEQLSLQEEKDLTKIYDKYSDIVKHDVVKRDTVHTESKIKENRDVAEPNGAHTLSAAPAKPVESTPAKEVQKTKTETADSKSITPPSKSVSENGNGKPIQVAELKLTFQPLESDIEQLNKGRMTVEKALIKFRNIGMSTNKLSGLDVVVVPYSMNGGKVVLKDNRLFVYAHALEEDVEEVLSNLFEYKSLLSNHDSPTIFRGKNVTADMLKAGINKVETIALSIKIAGGEFNSAPPKEIEIHPNVDTKVIEGKIQVGAVRNLESLEKELIQKFQISRNNIAFQAGPETLKEFLTHIEQTERVLARFRQNAIHLKLPEDMTIKFERKEHGENGYADHLDHKVPKHKALFFETTITDKQMERAFSKYASPISVSLAKEEVKTRVNENSLPTKESIAAPQASTVIELKELPQDKLNQHVRQLLDKINEYHQKGEKGALLESAKRAHQEALDEINRRAREASRPNSGPVKANTEMTESERNALQNAISLCRTNGLSCQKGCRTTECYVSCFDQEVMCRDQAHKTYEKWFRTQTSTETNKLQSDDVLQYSPLLGPPGYVWVYENGISTLRPKHTSTRP